MFLGLAFLCASITIVVISNVSTYPESRYAKMTTLGNAKDIANATLLYCEDNDGMTPLNFSNHQFLRRSLHGYLLYSQFESLNPEPSIFLPNSQIENKKLSLLENRSSIRCVFESNKWPDGKIAIAFLDGSAKFESP